MERNQGDDVTALDTGGAPMTWAHGPVVTRRRLGAELKRLRDASGLKLEEVARQLECSTSKISRLETGKGIPRWRDVRDMLDVYRVPDGDLRDRLLDWAQNGRARMWWQDYADVLPPDFATYVELEWDAAGVQAYRSDLVHGLLQTRDYARVVLVNAWGPARSADEIERLVDVRMRRQRALEPAHGLQLRCVLDESTLYRVAGDPTILRAQLEHLVDVTETGQVDVRILPFSAGLVAINFGSFSKLDFNVDLSNGVVYVEHPRGTPDDFLFDPADVSDHARRIAALVDVSLDERGSVARMKEAIQRLR